MLSWYLCSFQCPLNCEIRMANLFCFSPIISSLLAKRIMSSILGIMPSSLGALPLLICFLAFSTSSIVNSYYFNVIQNRVNVTQRCVFKGGSQQVLEMLIPLLFPAFLQGFSPQFSRRLCFTIDYCINYFWSLAGVNYFERTLNFPNMILNRLLLTFLVYCLCKSLLASILVTASGLLSSCGCYILLSVFRFSFVGRLFLHCSSV